MPEQTNGPPPATDGAGPQPTPSAATPLIQRERSLVRDLARIAAERAAAEVELTGTYATRKTTAEREHQKARREVEASLAAETEAAKVEHQKARQAGLSRFGTEQAAIEAKLREKREEIAAQVEADKEKSAAEHEDVRWQATTLFEAARDDVRRKYESLEQRFNADAQTLVPLQEEARFVHEDYAKYDVSVPEAGDSHEPDADGEAEAEAPEVDPGDPADNPVPHIPEAITELDHALYALKQLSLPKFIEWGQFSVVFLGLAIALGVPLLLVLKPWPLAVGLAVVGSVLIGLGLRTWLSATAHRQVATLRPALAHALADSEALVARCPAWIKARRDEEMAEAERKRDKAYRKADDAFRRDTQDARIRLDLEAQQAEDAFEKRAAELRRLRDEALRLADERFAKQVLEIKRRSQADFAKVEERYGPKKAAEQAAYQAAWDKMASRWHEGLDHALAEIEAIRAEDRRLFLPWEAWKAAPEVPPGVRFGDIRVDPSALKGGVPKEPQVRPALPAFDLPALVPLYGSQGSLMIKAGDPAGRDEAVELLHTTMLRLLTSLPPAKVRFTIIDPVGLGRNFAAFMHLADYDEQFVTSRIWTEATHIEQRLADLTEHMEIVIQKYLRNEYQTIEQYNAQAGEVAEPFRILVVANYPAGFNDNAARRLASVMDSGARCGVHTLISVDTKLAGSSPVPLATLEAQSLALEWKGGKFEWQKDEDFSKFPLAVDRGPKPEVVSKLMHEIGAASKAAKRVEVPFEVIAPANDRWWVGDSRSGLEVPLGRAGASRLQSLKLGKGTAQHMLVAGKTGSGKSTLMHALIVNAALRYSPDELEFYLIDFKKGVEFKTYAAYHLPHARVIAVESEREFGLSVLQRLDVELTRRGDEYRKVNAQDVASYRNSPEHPRCPRILLLIDEFQEFFVEDDKLSQEAALLLDRLVRQGRAFGIHVHLGSQTLAGAYSLARSTLGQIAIRIALQCSEADSHLILSEDNSAARLLSRPGEAIYNDANGLVEGNHPFQVVWLSDTKKEDYLRRLLELDRARGQEVPRHQIVFEGSIPALVGNNPRLEEFLRSPSWPTEPPKAPMAWLGEAIAIKDPTSAAFRPQGGTNLLIVGQDDEAATGILASTILSLAAQHPPDNARFVILDGLPIDSPLAGSLARVVDAVPHPSRVVAPREMASAIHEVGDEFDRRMGEAATGDLPSIYLIINDLQRFRDLRKGDDDFGFSSSRMDEDVVAKPSDRLAAILRDGPNVNIHVLVWCDTMTNVNRTIDRTSLREFELRVLFQMNANDSSGLIDSPIANRLGANRAFFNSESENILEKFRPYQIPDDDYLNRLREVFRDRPSPEPAEGRA